MIQMSAWAAAGVVFYFGIYNPAEEAKKKRRIVADVKVDKRPSIGKYSRFDDE